MPNPIPLTNDIKFLVYSSHKTGTQTLCATLQRNESKTSHLHLLRNINAEPGNGELSAFLNRYQESNGESLTLLSTFRLPIERHISSFFQWHGNGVIRAGHVATKHETIIAKESVNQLQQRFAQQLSDGSLAGYKESLHEICEELSLQPASLCYDQKQGYGVHETSNAKLVLFRFDQLFRRYPDLLENATGLRNLQIRKRNIGIDQWYQPIRAEFMKTLILPEDLVSRVCQEKRNLIDIFYPGEYDDITIHYQQIYCQQTPHRSPPHLHALQQSYHKSDCVSESPKHSPPVQRGFDLTRQDDQRHEIQEQQVTGQPTTQLPKIIWMLWLQGWDQAPDVAVASRQSWIQRNPDWIVHCLDRDSLPSFLPVDSLERIYRCEKPVEALSDQVRLELLNLYGGVWADATTICAQPLAGWLLQAMPLGFFAFSQPREGRLLSSWFLAAEKGNALIQRWHQSVIAYWHNRQERHDYFWLHILFEHLCADDEIARRIWDGTPKLPARTRFHFAPDSKKLFLPATQTGYSNSDLIHPPVPVFKLTHKFGSPPQRDSLFQRILTFATKDENLSEPFVVAKTYSPLRILVGWYGSFKNHGTIGDLLAVIALVSHLVGRGHQVVHSSASPLDIAGAEQIEWQASNPESFDVVIFSCGPILKQHKQTTSFFEHFTGCFTIGIGVSLLPDGDPNHYNPFNIALARQGSQRAYGDLAIAAPLKPQGTINQVQPNPSKTGRPAICIGIALRGRQEDYGLERCHSEQAEALFSELIELISKHYTVKIIRLEHRLSQLDGMPLKLEQQYRQCNLILTTRFHGGILALRNQRPFVAIDQIQDGGKVMPLLKELDWHSLFSIESMDSLELIQSGLNLLFQDQQESLFQARQKAVQAANITLHELDATLARVTPIHFSRGKNDA